MRKKIRKNLKNNAKREKFSSLQVEKIACLVDLDKIQKVDILQNLISGYGVRPENFIILGYKEQSPDTHLNGTPVFTWKDIDLSARVHNYHADRLAELTYDMLINYFNEPKNPLLLVSSNISAKIRVGLEGVGQDFNDIIIKSPLEKPEIFSQEIRKIIQTIR